MLKFPPLTEALFEERPNSQVSPRPDIRTDKKALSAVTFIEKSLTKIGPINIFYLS